MDNYPLIILLTPSYLKHCTNIFSQLIQGSQQALASQLRFGQVDRSWCITVPHNMNPIM